MLLPRGLAPAALALAVLTPAAKAQQVEMTLSEAVQHALAVDPAVIAARGLVTNGRWQRLNAFGNFLPTLVVGTSPFRVNRASFINGFSVQPGTFEYFSSFTATENLDLFLAGRISQYRAAGDSASAAAATLALQRYQVVVATQQAFFTTLADEDLVRVAEAQVTETTEELQTSVNKFLAGAATRSDTLTSTVDRGNAQYSLIQAQANLATAQANLARQVGMDGSVRAVADTAVPPLPDTLGLRASAGGSAPTLIQADAMASAASASAWAVRSELWPQLQLSYTSTSQGLTAPWHGFHDGNLNQNQLRFGISWTLFNGFGAEQSIAQATISRDIAQSIADSVRRELDAQFTEQVAAVFTARAQMGIAAANVAAASEAYRVQEERYKVGASALLDLETAEANLTQAQANQIQARYNYLIARVQLEALVGHPL